MAGDSASTRRWANASLDSTDPFQTVPRGQSKPHPKLTGFPAIQTIVLRIHPAHFPDGEVEAPSQGVLFFPRPPRIHW